MKIGVFVGSFNPIHKGHIQIVNYILGKKYVDKVFIIPTGTYWDKNNLLSIKDRSNMIKKYETDNIKVLDNLSNYQYTYEIFKYLESNYNDSFSLIIGADNIEHFDKWKEYKYLLEHELIIYKRDNLDINKYLDKLNKKDKVIVIDNVSNIDISSTKIRDSLNILYNSLDYNTLKYIIDNNLYKENNML